MDFSNPPRNLVIHHIRENEKRAYSGMFICYTGITQTGFAEQVVLQRNIHHFSERYQYKQIIIVNH